MRSDASRTASVAECVYPRCVSAGAPATAAGPPLPRRSATRPSPDAGRPGRHPGQEGVPWNRYATVTVG